LLLAGRTLSDYVCGWVPWWTQVNPVSLLKLSAYQWLFEYAAHVACHFGRYCGVVAVDAVAFIDDMLSHHQLVQMVQAHVCCVFFTSHLSGHWYVCPVYTLTHLKGMSYMHGTLRPKASCTSLNECIFCLVGMCTVLILYLASSLLILSEVPCI
jgi:hypothetical protein